jgi:hypothetical protein
MAGVVAASRTFMKRSLIVLVFAGATGCVSLQLPPEKVEHFEASMRTARAVGVYQMSPDDDRIGALGMAPAKEHLFLAIDEAEVAKTMAADGDVRGQLLLARAQSDVDLALELARETDLRRQARRAVAASKGTQVDENPTPPSHPKQTRGPWR